MADILDSTGTPAVPTPTFEFRVTRLLSGEYIVAYRRSEWPANDYNQITCPWRDGKPKLFHSLEDAQAGVDVALDALQFELRASA